MTDSIENSLDIQIDSLCIPHDDTGFLNNLIRKSGVRRATIDAGQHNTEYVSVVDIVSAANYRLASANWKNILQCYFQDGIVKARSWASIRDETNHRFIRPSITTSNQIHGKTAMITFRDSVKVLSRLPATREETVQDIRRLYQERDTIILKFITPLPARGLV